MYTECGPGSDEDNLDLCPLCEQHTFDGHGCGRCGYTAPESLKTQSEIEPVKPASRRALHRKEIDILDFGPYARR